MLTCKGNENGLSKVTDFCSNHVGWLVICESLSAALAMVSTIFFSYLLLAAFSFACWIENSIIVLDARNIAVQEEEVELVSIVLFLE